MLIREINPLFVTIRYFVEDIWGVSVQKKIWAPGPKVLRLPIIETWKVYFPKITYWRLSGKGMGGRKSLL